MNIEILFLIAGIGLCAGVFGCAMGWAAILKFSEVEAKIQRQQELIQEHFATMQKLNAVGWNHQASLNLLLSRIQNLEEWLNDSKHNFVSQKQVAALVHDALTREAH